MSSIRKGIFTAVFLSATALSTIAASAETILGALSKAYQFNSTMNSSRAGVRVTDEGVAIAKSGYRPIVQGSANASYASTRDINRQTTASFGIQINQMLFDGFQTKNNVAAAESQVFASQENLRNTEMNTLSSAAQAYMDVIRDRQIAVLREQNLKFLNEQVRAAKSRFDVGEGTRTDVAQAESAKSLAEAQLAAARAQAAASAASYRQIIGEEPGKLKAAAPLAKLLPKSLDSAYGIASAQHPAILSAQHLVDAAGFSVKSAEGALLPQVSASAGVSHNYSQTNGISSTTGLNGRNSTDTDTAQIGATLTIPIYSGGRTDALVRQGKESLGQARIQVDVFRDQVRQAVASAWTSYIAAQEAVTANRSAIAAAQLALNGVIEERNVGQRTTLDVLDAQQDVINAQINLANAENQVVVASYGILQATGQLYATRLGLQVAEYKPEEHYKAVKDKWIGLRTPDGR